MQEVFPEKCSGCEACVETCKEGALSVHGGKVFLDVSRCLYCGQCVKVCPAGAIEEAAAGYRILVGGKLGRHPKLARELRGVRTLQEALNTLERCLDLYQEHSRKGERFGEILERIHPDWTESL